MFVPYGQQHLYNVYTYVRPTPSFVLSSNYIFMLLCLAIIRSIDAAIHYDMQYMYRVAQYHSNRYYFVPRRNRSFQPFVCSTAA